MSENSVYEVYIAYLFFLGPSIRLKKVYNDTGVAAIILGSIGKLRQHSVAFTIVNKILYNSHTTEKLKRKHNIEYDWQKISISPPKANSKSTGENHGNVFIEHITRRLSKSFEKDFFRACSRKLSTGKVLTI